MFTLESKWQLFGKIFSAFHIIENINDKTLKTKSLTTKPFIGLLGQIYFDLISGKEVIEQAQAVLTVNG